MSSVVDLTIMMPAWNEVESIGIAVEAARTALGDLRRASLIDVGEIVVVDDGSTDGTGAALRAAAAATPELVVVSLATNEGVGSAIRNGLRASSGRLVFYTDADLPVSLSVLPAVLQVQREQRADVVAGYRRTRSHESMRRRLYGKSYNLLVRATLGVRFRDVNFAAKLFTASAIDRLHPRSNGILIDAELLAMGCRLGLRIVETPMDYDLRRFGTSSMSSPRRLVHLARELASLGSDIRRSADP